jgi:aurora kinase
MNPVKKNIRVNKVVSRFLPITKSVLEGLEPEPKITDFTLIKELGEGSFSRVLLVQHNITQAQYAIKAIDKRNKDNIEEKDYFKREAEIMYRINHPNIVKLYGHFEDNTYCYFIMEYMSGGNAYSLVPKYGQRKISPKMAASILKDVISATYYLHHMYPPIIHRDIKPENVLINSEMKAKLTDFGWSNYLNKSNMKRMTMCGTPIYLAPELVNNYGHDHRVDIWCIGVLMFELLTGQPPWIGEDVPTLKYNISNMKIRWPKNMDPDAVDLLKKTLRYNPDERISLRNMLMHPFFTKYYPDAVNSLIKPDGKKQRIYVISRDNPNIYYTSFNNTYNNNIIYNSSSSNSNIIYNSGNNDIIYPTTINEIPYIPPSNITTTSYPIPSLTLNTSYYDTSNNFNNFNNIINTVPDISSIPSISLNDYGYTDKTYNSLNIKEFLENQERIDELVRKTEKNDSRNKIIFQSSYPSYNYNISNTLPVLHHSSSVYKTQSPFYFSNNNSVYQPQVNKNIKYSLPITKYSIQPVKYKKPQIIYSSLTAKRNFEGDIYGKRQLNNLYNKYGLNFK